MRYTPIVSAVLAAVLAPAAPAQDEPHTFVRTFEVEGQQVIVDNTNARLGIDVIDEFEDQPKQADYARRLFKSYTDAAAKCPGEFLPSVSLMGAKGKKFDDGMYAAVELAAEKSFGAKLRLGKVELLRRVLLSLADRHPQLSGYPRKACGEAIALVASALAAADQLGKLLDDGPAVDLDRDVGRKPVGFYTWTPELEGIFRRDTALQVRCDFRKPLEVAAAAIMADVVHSDDLLRAEHEDIIGLYARLTNPLRSMTVAEMVAEIEAAGGLEQAIADEAAAAAFADALSRKHPLGLALLPPSESKEMFLLWQAGALGLSSMDAFIDAIRSGKIDLEPDEDSGWYEYQQYALQPLLIPEQMPEGQKLKLSEKYREHLAEAFKSMMAQVRETHVKQLGSMMGPGALEPIGVEVRPHLAVEPIATTYLRIGDGYEFLRGVLQDKLGPEALTGLHVRRDIPTDGSVRPPGRSTLGLELDALQTLMYGAYCLALRDVGAPLKEREGRWDPSDPSFAAEQWMARAEAWLSRWQEDPDMERDVRMMIPVAADPNIYWAVIGVKMTEILVRFERVPHVYLAGGERELELDFKGAAYWVATERFIEVREGEQPLNREEFRALCDKARTEEKIIEALQKRGFEAVSPGSAGTGPAGTGPLTGLLPPGRQGGAAALPLLALPALAIVVVVLWLLRRSRVR